MPVNETGFFYLALVLPGLFSLSLIAEGVNKLLKEESGWVSISFGVIFLIMILFSYFFILR